ncbi:uncharacterized protein BO80DRAFT_491913 [Aspergillus ibericus CBS 121593]|uniref:Kelch repeat protein n=1 Tax=Aspergillus ibericus CBS 121593 TaxID=1448316 RepID=A0A395H689_9EURO|nr:hypothetical protein BO80DRAFT_491913 [Aspergillus ibericus CBS 121593]RAL03140.1 hypothetical protein BO80DRAFT_491913 [Aspergillus ibericus CBS 121593]
MTIVPLPRGMGMCVHCFPALRPQAVDVDAIINNQTLFIDGGEVRYLEDNDTISAYAIRDLQTIGVSKSFSNTDSDQFTHIEKPYNASDPDAYPTFCDEGSQFKDGQNLYFYGGYISGRDGLKDVAPVETWKYNIQSNNWTRDGFGGVPYVRLAEGGAVVSYSQNKAYYLGGIEDPGGNPNVYGTAGADVQIVSGLLTLDQSTLTWSSLSTEEMSNYGTIGAGYVNILEDVGDEGLLVSFGGYKYPTNDSYHNPMEYITLYDIANQTWYTQQSTGDIPSWRMAGCSITVAAADRSSFSIYDFGGMGATTANSDGDVYVLSLPSFRWIRVNEGSSIREKHTCNLLGNHTMIVVGGTIPTDSSEYEPKPVNCDSGQFENGIAIFNLNNHTWLTDYNAADTSEICAQLSDYRCHWRKKAVITTPTSATTAATAAANATSTSAQSNTSNTGSSKGGLSKGGIVGVTIGAVAGVSVIAGLVFFMLKRKRAQPTADSEVVHAPGPAPQGHFAELSGGHEGHELGQDGISSVPAAEVSGNWWQKTPIVAEMDGVGVVEKGRCIPLRFDFEHSRAMMEME